jgi:hypothetical protein
VEKYDGVGQTTDDNTAHVVGILSNGVHLWSHTKKKKGPMIIGAPIAHHITTSSYIGA